MERTAGELDSGVLDLLTRIRGGQIVGPEEHGSGKSAVSDGLAEQDPKGHLTLTARGRQLADTSGGGMGA